MTFLMGLLLFSGLVFGVEVTTLESAKTTNEFVVITTDETFQAALEKQYLAQTCRPRISINGTIREFFFANSCRAEVTKFTLNNGHKPDQLFRTFTK